MAQDATPMPVRSSRVPAMRAATLGPEHGAVRPPSFSAMSQPLVNDSLADLLGQGGTCGEMNREAGPGGAQPSPGLCPQSQASIQVGWKDWALARACHDHGCKLGWVQGWGQRLPSAGGTLGSAGLRTLKSEPQEEGAKDLCSWVWEKRAEGLEKKECGGQDVLI